MKFIIHTSEDGQYYYEIRSRNGKTLVVSETMKQKRSCLNAIRSIMKESSSGKILE